MMQIYLGFIYLYSIEDIDNLLERADVLTMSIHGNTETYKIVNNEKSVMLYEKMDLNYYKNIQKRNFYDRIRILYSRDSIQESLTK